MLRLRSCILLLWVAVASGPAVSEEAPTGEVCLRDRPCWQALDRALSVARENSQVTLVFVSARGCGPCRLMENEVFAEVRPLLDQMALAKLDMTDSSMLLAFNNGVITPSRAALQMGIESTPGFVLVDPEGTPILRETGLLDATAFGLFLAYGTTGAYRHGSFADYAAAMRWPPGAAVGGE